MAGVTNSTTGQGQIGLAIHAGIHDIDLHVLLNGDLNLDMTNTEAVVSIKGPLGSLGNNISAVFDLLLGSNLDFLDDQVDGLLGLQVIVVVQLDNNTLVIVINLNTLDQVGALVKTLGGDREVLGGELTLLQNLTEVLGVIVILESARENTDLVARSCNQSSAASQLFFVDVDVGSKGNSSHHHDGQHKCEYLFHVCFLHKILIFSG